MYSINYLFFFITVTAAPAIITASDTAAAPPVVGFFSVAPTADDVTADEDEDAPEDETEDETVLLDICEEDDDTALDEFAVLSETDDVLVSLDVSSFELFSSTLDDESCPPDVVSEELSASLDESASLELLSRIAL